MRGPQRFDPVRFQRVLQARGLDAVIGVSPENVYYTSGTLITTQKLIRERLAFVVLPANGAPTLIVAIMEEALSRAESSIADIRAYVEFAESPVHALATVLQEKGLAQGRVGIELNYLAAQSYLELTRVLPGIELVAGEDVFWELRMLKSPEEVKHLAHIARLTETCIVNAFAETHPLMTEREVATRMREQLLCAGAETIPLLVLASGVRSIYAHPTPNETPLQAGDIIRVDFCGEFDGYFSDLQRTAVVGEPNAHQSDVYRRVRQAQQRTIERMRPGVRACDVFDASCKAYMDVGLVMEEPHIGHGLGIGLHELPVLEPGNRMELQPGMVFAVEPDYIEPDVACYCVEDLVHITESGPVLLSDAFTTDSMIVI